VIKLTDLGERKAIQIISKILSKGNVVVGIGDDCAAFEFGKEYLLVTTDMISQKIHIPKEMTPFQIGWFLVAINLSDIAAKGGAPLGLVLSFGLPKETSEAFLKELAKGANACAISYDTTIVGGDTKESIEITLCGTAFGIVKKDEFMSRIGANPGDIIAITGTMGKAGAGHYNLKNKILNHTLSKALLEPLPKLREGRLLAKQKSVSSCMDISDGLSSSLYQLLELNNVGFELDISSLPISSELIQLHKKQRSLDINDIALHFGGDYELLVTIPSKKFEKVKKTLNNKNMNLTAIGFVTRKKEIVIKDGNIKKTLENKGFEHFKNNTY